MIQKLEWHHPIETLQLFPFSHYKNCTLLLLAKGLLEWRHRLVCLPQWASLLSAKHFCQIQSHAVGLATFFSSPPLAIPNPVITTRPTTLYTDYSLTVLRSNARCFRKHREGLSAGAYLGRLAPGPLSANPNFWWWYFCRFTNFVSSRTSKFTHSLTKELQLLTSSPKPLAPDIAPGPHWRTSVPQTS